MLSATSAAWNEWAIFWVPKDIKLMNNASLQRGARCGVIRPWNERVVLEVRDARRTRILVCRDLELAAIEAPQDCGITLTQPDRARENGFKYGLQIRRRAADGAQDLACRRLLLRCLG